jgi:hypothetical protein
MIRKWFLIGVLASVVVILIADFLKEAVFYDPLGKLEEQAVEEGSKETAPPAGFEPGWREAIYEKNLFSRDRGYVPPPPPVPPATEAVPPPPPPPPRPEFTLRGIVAENGTNVAIVESPKSGTLALKVGDVAEMAELVRIESKRVVFRWMGEDIVLTMEKVKTLAR